MSSKIYINQLPAVALPLVGTDLFQIQRTSLAAGNQDRQATLANLMGMAWTFTQGVTVTPPADTPGLVISGAVLTSGSFPLMDLAAVWNNGGALFTGIKLNVTDTASFSSAMLMDLQVGGGSMLSVRKDGRLVIAGSLISLGSGNFTGAIAVSSLILGSLTSDTGSAGTLWFRSDLKGLRYYDGAAIQMLLQGSDGSVLDGQRVLSSALPNIGTSLTVAAATAYFVYLGKVTADFTPQFVEFVNTTGAGGTGVGEVGLFSTPLAPNKSGQTLTKLAAVALTANNLTGTGIFRNASAFATLIPRGTHLWAAVRSSYQGPQATMSALCADFGAGRLLTSAGAGALTGVTTLAGTIPAINTTINTGIAPDLRCVLD